MPEGDSNTRCWRVRWTRPSIVARPKQAPYAKSSSSSEEAARANRRPRRKCKAPIIEQYAATRPQHEGSTKLYALLSYPCCSTTERPATENVAASPTAAISSRTPTVSSRSRSAASAGRTPCCGTTPPLATDATSTRQQHLAQSTPPPCSEAALMKGQADTRNAAWTAHNSHGRGDDVQRRRCRSTSSSTRGRCGQQPGARAGALTLEPARRIHMGDPECTDASVVDSWVRKGVRRHGSSADRASKYCCAPSTAPSDDIVMEQPDSVGGHLFPSK